MVFIFVIGSGVVDAGAGRRALQSRLLTYMYVADGLLVKKNMLREVVRRPSNL